MNYFDKTFVVSLNNEVGRQRMTFLDPHLKEQGIEYELWEACEHPNGAEGLIQSMYWLFRMCIEKEYESVLILEDDSQFVVDFWPFMDETWPQLPKDYHMLMLACTLIARPERVSENILRISASYCTNAIVYSKEAMKLILPMIKKYPTRAFDITLMRELQPEGKCYATFPQMCFQREGYSSIEKKSMNWKQYQTEAWNMYTRNI